MALVHEERGAIQRERRKMTGTAQAEERYHTTAGKNPHVVKNMALLRHCRSWYGIGSLSIPSSQRDFSLIVFLFLQSSDACVRQ